MNSQKKRVLVVDDEPSITRLLRLNLEQTGVYQVATENAPHVAVSAAERFRPDVILLDVMMPEIDGGSLADQIKNNPRLKDVPIIFLTAAVTHQEVRERHGIVGGLPFLAKPVELSEVLACLAQQLGHPAHSRDSARL